VFLEYLQESSIVRLAAIGSPSKRFGVHKDVGESMFARAFERRRVEFIADHRNDLRLYLAGFDRIDNGLKVGPTAGGEHRYAKRRGPLSRHTRPLARCPTTR
jgi:hypothetical protein